MLPVVVKYLDTFSASMIFLRVVSTFLLDASILSLNFFEGIKKLMFDLFFKKMDVRGLIDLC